MSEHVAVWVVGEPGVGKSTLVRGLLRFGKYPCSLNPKPKWTLGARGWCAAGHYTGEMFDGGDTIAYDGAQEALNYWEQRLLPGYLVTLFDGDRFSSAPVKTRVSPLVGHVVAVHLGGERAAQARRVARGSAQSPTWVKGRRTKAQRFAEGFDVRLMLDAEQTPETLVSRVEAFIGEGLRPSGTPA